MALPVLASIGRQELLGFAMTGVGLYTNRLVKLGRFLEKHVLAQDEKAGQEMVDRMKADVPQDTGRLYSGISSRREGNEIVVEASAIRTNGNGSQSIDYAFLVEHGHQAYHAYFSYDAFDGSAGRRVTPVRSGRGEVSAQPFFYDNARDVLEERGAAMENVIGLGYDDAEQD